MTLDEWHSIGKNPIVIYGENGRLMQPNGKTELINGRTGEPYDNPIMVGVVYLVVVLGFGEAPDESERRVLGLAILAGIVAVLLYAPVRNWLSDVANRRVYGERRAPDEPLQTFGARMSRAIPL